MITFHAIKKILDWGEFMKDIILYCTRLRNEEKALMIEATKRKLPIKHVLSRDGIIQARLPSMAIIRTLGHAESIAISSMVELCGTTTINSSMAIRHCADKGMAAMLMKAGGVHQPDFDIAFSQDHLARISSRFKYPFVIKPVSASWGRGVCLVRDNYCLENWLAGRESIDANNRHFPIMVQEYIEKPGYDIRMMIVGNKPVVAFKRKSEHWITNTHLGATVEIIDINEPMKDLSSKIIAAVGPGFFGLDIFETIEGKYLFNEINHNPDFAKSSLVHGVGIANCYVDYIEEVYDTAS